MGILTSLYGGVTAINHSEIPSLFEQSDLDVATLLPFRGRPILIVNTASKCGFASQYDALEALSQRYDHRLPIERKAEA